VWLEGLKIGIGYYMLIMITKFVIFNDAFTWKKRIGNLIGTIVIGLISASLIKGIYRKKSKIQHS
jgi:hypothetical protein